ncbi:hypothetical protein L9F63_021776, partial [Diploptera punctata]
KISGLLAVVLRLVVPQRFTRAASGILKGCLGTGNFGKVRSNLKVDNEVSLTVVPSGV